MFQYNTKGCRTTKLGQIDASFRRQNSLCGMLEVGWLLVSKRKSSALSAPSIPPLHIRANFLCSGFDDIATIAIQEEDLHLLPDGMHAVVNEEIKAQFDALENRKRWGMFPTIWFECIKHPAGCLKSLILPGLHNPLMTLGPKRKTRHKSCLSFGVSAF